MKKVKRAYLVVLLVVVAVIVGVTAYALLEHSKTELRVICAGSLMVPFTEMEKAYEALNPHIDVLTEGHGSIQVIRYVTELGTEADIVAVADHSLIHPMMYDVKIPDSDDSYASWYIRFASNTLGLAYTSSSKYADEINANNWYEILSRPDVRLGMSDPRFDACGYRAMMSCWLAGLFYNDSDIFENVIGDFDYPVTFEQEDGQCTMIIPEIVKSQKISIRGSSVVLLGILESGDIDYAFEYKSVALQRNLNFLELPPEINLGSNDFEKLGYDLRIKIDYQRFASVIPEFACQMILYGVTIPENNPHYEEAVKYLEFMLGPDGTKIFADNYQPFLSLVADNYDRVPEDLKLVISPGE